MRKKLKAHIGKIPVSSHDSIRLEFLQQLSNRLEPDALLQCAAAAAGRLKHWEAVRGYLPSNDGQSWQMRVENDSTPGDLGTSQPMQTGLIGECFQSAQVQFSEDPKDRMAVPVVFAGKSLAVIELETIDPADFTEKEISFALELAGILALALKNAQNPAEPIGAQKKPPAVRPVTPQIVEKPDTSLTKFPDENPNPVMRVDTNCLLMYANPASAPFLASWGRSIGSAVPDDWREIISSILSTERSRVVDVEIGGRLYTCDFVFVRDGGYINIYGRDITDYKRAEMQIAKLAERLDLATRSAGMGVWDWDIVNNQLIWDDRMYALYGLEPGGFGGAYNAWVNSLHPDDRELSDQQSAAAVRGEHEYDTEFRVLWPDGSVHWLKAAGQVFRDGSGKALRMVGLNYDISSQKENEKALRQSRENFALAFNSNPAAVVITRLSDGKFIKINAAHTRIIGYQPEEIIGRTATDIQIYANLEERKEILRLLKEENAIREREVHIRVKSGEIRTLVMFMEKIQYDDETCILSTLFDITERKQIENELRANKKLLQDIVDNTSALIYITDRQGRFVLVNHKIEQIFGLDASQIIGHVRQDFIPAELAQSHHDNELKIMETGRSENFVEENVETDGRHVYLTTKFPLYDNDGHIYAVCGISTDMTDLKRMEEDLRRSNAELEQFAYIASHDLQEPLRTVAGMVELLQQRYKGRLDERADEYISYAVDASDRMQKLINDLLDYSRVGRFGQPFEPVALENVLKIVLNNLKTAIDENEATITHAPLPTVFADSGQMVQVLQNLVANAIKFHSDRPVEVHIGAEKLDNDWCISVRDNGIGIEPQYFERIFLIFQRLHTRRKYDGTGIGLALCQKIIERHGGKIWLESKPASGSTFYFTIPEKLK